MSHTAIVKGNDETTRGLPFLIRMSETVRPYSLYALGIISLIGIVTIYVF